jgi:hypothetical protein
VWTRHSDTESTERNIFSHISIADVPAAACRSLARPRGGSVFIFLLRAACAVAAVGSAPRAELAR